MIHQLKGFVREILQSPTNTEEVTLLRMKYPKRKKRKPLRVNLDVHQELEIDLRGQTKIRLVVSVSHLRRSVIHKILFRREHRRVRGMLAFSRALDPFQQMALNKNATLSGVGSVISSREDYSMGQM